MILSDRTRRVSLAVIAIVAALSLAVAVAEKHARAIVPAITAGKTALLNAASDATQENADPASIQAPIQTPAAAAVSSTSAPIGAVTYRSLVPSDWLEAQGAKTNSTLIATAAQQNRLLPATNPQVIQVRAILQKLIPYSLKWNDRAKNWQWEVNVVRSPDIDAICLPGGKLVIDTGMLERLGLNEDETALLMSHLIAHALREHARARIGQQQVAELNNGKVPNANLFDAKGASDAAINVGPELLAMRYGPDDETEADVIGADIASRAGYDPRAGLALWQKVDRIARRRPVPPFTLAHPVSDKRLKDLKKRQKDMLPLYAKATGKSVDTLPPYHAGHWYPGGKPKPAVNVEEPVEKHEEAKPFSFITQLPHRFLELFRHND